MLTFCRDVQIGKIGRRRSPRRTRSIKGPRTSREPYLFSIEALSGFWVRVQKGRTDGRIHMHFIGNRVKKGPWQNIWTDIRINTYYTMLHTHYIYIDTLFDRLFLLLLSSTHNVMSCTTRVPRSNNNVKLNILFQILIRSGLLKWQYNKYIYIIYYNTQWWARHSNIVVVTANWLQVTVTVT